MALADSESAAVVVAVADVALLEVVVVVVVVVVAVVVVVFDEAATRNQLRRCPHNKEQTTETPTRDKKGAIRVGICVVSEDRNRGVFTCSPPPPPPVFMSAQRPTSS